MKTKTTSQTAVAAALLAMGADIFEIVDSEEHDDDTYPLLGQTDTRPNVWGIRSTPERAEIANLDPGDHEHVIALLRALGWREVPDNYAQSHAFYLP